MTEQKEMVRAEDLDVVGSIFGIRFRKLHFKDKRHMVVCVTNIQRVMKKETK